MSVLTVLIIVFFVQSFIIEQNVATGIIKTEKKALEQSINQLTDFLDNNLHSYETINYLNGNNQGTIDAFLANDLGKLTQLAKEFTSPSFGNFSKKQAKLCCKFPLNKD